MNNLAKSFQIRREWIQQYKMSSHWFIEELIEIRQFTMHITP